MLKITFLDVGTGDSIVIEWKEKNKNKIAVIDCNLCENNRNPTIDYIRGIKYNFNRTIDFVILSHPHSDHFTGLESFIDFCYNEKIKIEKFYHTLTYNKEFLQSLGIDEKKAEEKCEEILFPVKGTSIGSPRSKLNNLLRSIRINIEKSLPPICNLHPIEDDKEIILNNKFKLRVLAPSSIKDIVKYIKNPEEFADSGVSDIKNKHEGNILSTVISIEDKSWYLLLTSDAKKEVFERIFNDEGNKDLLNKNLKLLQIPHHGSKNNHNPKIWIWQKNKCACTAAISVGNKNQYNLPSKEVVDFFTSKDYKFYSTSNKNVGFSEIKRKEVLLNAVNFTENCYFEIVPESGNISFTLNENGDFELLK